MTDPIKAKIQELCLDVTELKFGCKVAYEGYVGVPHIWHAATVLQTMASGKIAIYSTHAQYFDKEHLRIDGSPITLAVVLRAIKNLKLDYAVMVDQEGGFVTALAAAATSISVLKGWNLEHDNYDQQSEECKQFIGSLLVNEK